MKKILFTILILFMTCGVGYCQYTDSLTTAYVDTDNGTDDVNHGNASGSSAYATMSYAESQQDRDITGTASGITFNCVGVTADGHFDFAGWTTDATHQITMNGNNTGKTLSDQHYRVVTTDANDCISIGTAYVTINNVQAALAYSSYSGRGMIKCSSGEYVTVNNFIGYCNFDGNGDGEASAIEIVDNSSDDNLYTFTNSIFYNVGDDNVGYGLWADNINDDTVTVTNCSFYGFNEGIRIDVNAGDETVNIYNTLVIDNTDDFNGTFDSIDYCASDDGDGTNAVDVTAQDDDDWAALVEDAAGGDFSPTDASSLLYDAGSASYAPATDIMDTSRPQGSADDISAIELIVAEAGRRVIFRNIF